MVCCICGKLPTPQDGRTENRPGEWQQCEICGEWFCPDCAEEALTEAENNEYICGGCWYNE